ncbi:uncharacterized protein LOC122661879 [Telopea speciosissima]|uniref:uncharacterized protein LOC122661879 n=1 Tax=Telopea speciosissima TaxID=54955 RepID=UPI001CC4D3A8|nr:uncharacterized protein LOC122661879 [Telopea speciosissima]XP_043713325.1 uncharacterized protein LOC122661879 [Telopea speciosissima]
MASSVAKVSCRVVFVILVLVVGFYVGRPLYWKLSATIHEIREKRQTVKEGISQFVLEARRSVGWVHDESNSDRGGGKVSVASTRRILGVY